MGWNRWVGLREEGNGTQLLAGYLFAGCGNGLEKDCYMVRPSPASVQS